MKKEYLNIYNNLIKLTRNKSLFIKSGIKDKNQSVEIKKVSGWIFIQILKMIHPVMPFLSEKLWKDLFNKDEFLMLQKFLLVIILLFFLL